MNRHVLLLVSAIVLFTVVDAASRRPLYRPTKPIDTNIGPDNVTQHAGYIAVNGTLGYKTNIFYWMFESRSAPKTDPLVIWFTGGPGCSSEIAFFYENGPYTLNQNLSLNINPYSWNTFSNILYVDQPVGTGFSYGEGVLDYDINEDQIARDMYEFMQNFFKQYPQYSKLPFYITGESYAGHYIPAISYKIYEENKKGEQPQINLKGLAIGNGWVDPYAQYAGYRDFAIQHGFLNTTGQVVSSAALTVCKGLIDTGLYPVAFIECNIYMQGILGAIALSVGYDPNVYNIDQVCEYPPLCYDFSLVDKFLAQPEVQKALGVTGQSWTECSQPVHTLLLGDWMSNLDVHIPELLRNGYEVLVYSGELDFICNWVGGNAWTSALEWDHKAEFNQQKFAEWKVKGAVAGWAKNFDNFTFLKVAKAGHMVPLDQPENALAMLKQFISGKWTTA